MQFVCVVMLYKNTSVQEAAHKVSANTNKALLFFLQEQYCVKVDCYDTAATDVSCCCDAIKFLIKVYYTHNLEYEYELKPVFGLLE